MIPPLKKGPGFSQVIHLGGGGVIALTNQSLSRPIRLEGFYRQTRNAMKAKLHTDKCHGLKQILKILQQQNRYTV